jgi:hypothetical protein
MTEDLNALKLELAELAKRMKANHLKFAQGLARGESQEKAWVNAGSKSKKPAVDASKTINNYPSIIQYKDLFLKIAALEALPKQIATFEQKRKMLWEIANKAANLKVSVKEGHSIAGEIRDEDEPLEIFDASAARTAIGAIAELNKMDGDLAAIKMESKISGSLTVESLIEELTGGTTK